MGFCRRAQVSSEEDRVFESRSSQSGDLPNLFLPLPSLVLRITRIGQGFVWLAQYQGSVIEWKIGSWCWQLDLPPPLHPVGQHYKVAMGGALSQVDTSPDMTLGAIGM